MELNLIPPRRGTHHSPSSNVTSDVVWRELPDLPGHLRPEILNLAINALRDSRIPDAEEQLLRFLTRIGFDLYLQASPTVSRGSGYLFESMHLHQRITFPRADEHRVRQALSRFRSKQPLWRFRLLVDPTDPYKMQLTRTA